MPHQPARNSDSTPAPPPPDILTNFAPVPRNKNRFNGWTADRQRQFIAQLAYLGSAKAAARAVGMGGEGVYHLRRHPQAHGFRAAWDAALGVCVQRLEDVAIDRALNGVEEAVWYRGEEVGQRRVYSDRLLMFLLRNRAPTRFAADSIVNAGATTRSHLERLKREWRAEWEAERTAETEREEEEILASIDAKLDVMQSRITAHKAFRAENPDLFPGAPDPDDIDADSPNPDTTDTDSSPPESPQPHLTAPGTHARYPHHQAAQKRVLQEQAEAAAMAARWAQRPPHHPFTPAPQLPPPYYNPQTPEEAHIADYLRHLHHGRIGPKARLMSGIATPEVQKDSG